MPISEMGSRESHFSPENDREGRFGGLKMARNGAGEEPRSEVGGPRSEIRGLNGHFSAVFSRFWAILGRKRPENAEKPQK